MGNIIQKVAVIGDPGVGKSALITRYEKGKFQTNYIMTIGVDFLTKTFETAGQTVTLSIWDMAGQERFNFMRPKFYFGVAAAIIAFDLTSYKTFQRLGNWYNELKKNSGDVPVILIGTKADLANNGERAVSWEEATKYAEERGLDYFENSSKTGNNVEPVFRRLAHLSLYQACGKKIPDYLKDYNQIYQKEIRPLLLAGFKFSQLLFSP